MNPSSENIWIAASDGDIAGVKHYLAKGIDVNAQDDLGYSPIHAAASYGHVEAVKFLLASGANPKLVDQDGDTPLHACEEAVVAGLLLDAGADMGAKNSQGKPVSRLIPKAWPSITLLCCCRPNSNPAGA